MKKCVRPLTLPLLGVLCPAPLRVIAALMSTAVPAALMAIGKPAPAAALVSHVPGVLTVAAAMLIKLNSSAARVGNIER